jgi:hypothetical protein
VGDTVQQVDQQRGKVLGRWEVGAVHVLEPGRAVVARHVPPSGLPIIGGPTAKMSRWIMGGREVRAMAWSSRHKRVFVASTRPNIGPNPRRWEVSMNGGISVVDPVDGYERHVSIRRGSDETAATAILGGALPEPRPGQALLRPLAELGKGRRNPASLHSGPAALALSPDGATLYALLRFSHQVVEYDTSGARDGTLIERRRHDLSPLPAQAERHLGEVAYVTDLANSAMTCDGCHPAGRAAGVLFTKGQPMRIYRSPPVVGTPVTPPYFTPARFPTVAHVSSTVLGRTGRHGFPAPSLLGNWDVFPQLMSGAAGMSVTSAGEVDVTHKDAARRVLELSAGGRHGQVDDLTIDQRDDRLAYLRTL